MFQYYPPRYLFRRYEILRLVRPADIFLEIGAGELNLSQELLKYFSRGKAIDFSPETMSCYTSLKPFITKRLSFEVTDVNNIHEEDFYDCVVSCEVMEHLDNDATFLLKIFRLLKPHGQAILSVPANMKFWSIHDEITGHCRRYERKKIIELFQSAGFENINVIAYGYPFVNMLRWIRVLYATRQAKIKRQWNRVQRTQQSGIHHVPSKFSWLGLLVNPHTILPLNWIARLFNTADLSEGYIITADKNTKRASL